MKSKNIFKDKSISLERYYMKYLHRNSRGAWRTVDEIFFSEV